jgi:hypothetical protein
MRKARWAAKARRLTGRPPSISARNLHRSRSSAHLRRVCVLPIWVRETRSMWSARLPGRSRHALLRVVRHAVGATLGAVCGSCPCLSCAMTWLVMSIGDLHQHSSGARCYSVRQRSVRDQAAARLGCPGQDGGRIAGQRKSPCCARAVQKGIGIMSREGSARSCRVLDWKSE